jgi:hypothetical protein
MKKVSFHKKYYKQNLFLTQLCKGLINRQTENIKNNNRHGTRTGTDYKNCK